ncbi:mitogen-activated protein kinase kinase 2-like isoform X2 [Actinidia eriantha]|uniref:mitogen-activated protein kinase kinase 2-like isoform X2 n=1 Tax=Actinidia eriantha TaxID=165200 RepID=UPI00258A9B38|nr:mitogen-activated protein kinase kinase 2-like isoform X2 [Actinidia eriantha]
MKKGALGPNLKLSLPPPDEAAFAKFLTESGTFMDGDLLVNRDGVRIVSESNVETPPLIQPSDNQISLADFDAIKVIGKGNGGVVRLVQHKWTGQFFALKVIQMNIEESARRQIAQELKINQSSQSPYVVVCYQSFFENGAISIILEYMDGGSLADFLNKVKTVPEPYLAAICKQPERISGGKYGYRSDIWSFGLVLLECALGRFPYSPPQQGEGWDNVYELMETIVDQPPPCAPADQFSPEFCSFISECLQKDPKDRRSANELMRHPFINMFEDLDIDLSSYFTDAGSPLATF